MPKHDVIVSPNASALNLIRAVLPMTAGGTADQDFLTSTVTLASQPPDQ